jgi:ABC-type phosphate transport system substrate-binding protein
MRKFLTTVAATAATLCLLAAPAAAQDFKVIVNSANSTTELPSATVGKIFLKETAKFPNGTAAAPVDQNKASATRAAFSKAVVGRPVAAVETHWQQQIFSGKEVPPPNKASDDDVIAFVKSNPGGIGYVSAGAATSGVKVIDVK